MGFPYSSVSKESACSVGDLRSNPSLGRSPGEGNGNPFQYSCLKNFMDRGAWWATVHGVTKSRTQLSDFTLTHCVPGPELVLSYEGLTLNVLNVEVKVAQSCLTLSDPMDCSLPGSSIHGIIQARVLEWGAIAFSKTSIVTHIND